MTVAEESRASRPFWSRPTTAVLLIVAAGTLLLIPLPQEGREVDAFGDMVHAPMFASLAVVLQRAVFLRFFRNMWRAGGAAWLTISVLGILSELVQLQVGREGSVEDAAADLLGASAGILWSCSSAVAIVSARRRLRLGAVAMFAVALWLPATILFDCARQRLRTPVIASFEDDLEMTRWNPHDARLTREQAHVTDGGWAMRVDIDAAKYPGAAMKWPAPNWMGYSRLAFDAACENGQELELTVKVEDADHNNHPDDRFQQRLQLTSTMTRFEVNLADVAALPSGRRMDLHRIALLQFYVRRPSGRQSFYIDNIRLE